MTGRRRPDQSQPVHRHGSMTQGQRERMRGPILPMDAPLPKTPERTRPGLISRRLRR